MHFYHDWARGQPSGHRRFGVWSHSRKQCHVIERISRDDQFLSATSITITIPSGATSGYLVVSVAPDMDSNPVFFTITSQPLPSPWLDSDVGQVTQRGSATYSGGTFTVNGEGAGLGNTVDGFHVVYPVLYPEWHQPDDQHGNQCLHRTYNRYRQQRPL